MTSDQQKKVFEVTVRRASETFFVEAADWAAASELALSQVDGEFEDIDRRRLLILMLATLTVQSGRAAVMRAVNGSVIG